MSKQPSYVGTFFERFVEQGMEKGLQEGRQEGRQEGSRTTATRVFYTILGARWPTMDTSELKSLTESATQEALFEAVELVAKVQDSPQARNRIKALFSERSAVVVPR